MMASWERISTTITGISIIENATRLGLPIPEKLRDVLEQLKDGGDKDGTK